MSGLLLAAAASILVEQAEGGTYYGYHPTFPSPQPWPLSAVLAATFDPCAPLFSAAVSSLQTDDTYSNDTGYYHYEQRAGTVDHVASAYIPTCREEPQWGLGWRHLPSGFWLRRILTSIESFNNRCGVSRLFPKLDAYLFTSDW